VAYYTTPVDAGPIEAEALRAHVAATLPAYMVPAAYVRLAQLPVTPNGKVDRRALPAPDRTTLDDAMYEPPQDDVERTLAAIWAELLHVERVGRHDNFFALGGHSLLAVTLLERMRRHGIQVDARDIFAHPTVAELAVEHVEEIRL
jgi:aryl carrier-like protein